MVFATALIGLALTFIGAVLAAKGVIIKDAEASMIAGTYWNENPHLKKALLAQSRLAKWGLVLVAVGTAFQAFSLILDHFG